MGGQGKGGARAAYLPPARSRRPAEGEGGPTITEKIKARKAAGGAEGWDEFKARIREQKQTQHELENQDVMMSAQHRELLDRERDARLRRDPQQAERKRKERSGSSSEDESESESDSSSREKKKRKHKHKHHKHKSGDKDKKKSKHKHRKKHRHRHRDSGAERPAAAGPVKLSEFLAVGDSDASG